MSKPLAQSSKDKGNAAFKSGDYPTAIGHYTAAILADPDDITFSLNRAAAYLKLGKFQDAEMDCSTVLVKNPKNVKALFRRGQAHIELGNYEKGRQDLSQALAQEPNNEAVKGELARVESLQNENTTRKSRIVGKPETPPKRRRVPIKIVEAPTATITTPGVTENTLEPVSSRKLTSPTIISDGPFLASTGLPSTQVTPPPPPKSFVEAKQAREATKTTRVGGGIFRPSGQHTTFQTRNLPFKTTSPEERSPSFQADPAHKANKPTLFNFSRIWEYATQQERWKLLLTLTPSGLPSMFQTSLEPTMLVSILENLHWALENDMTSIQSGSVEHLMTELAQVPRFKTVLLLLSGKERQYAKRIWDKLEIEAVGEWKAVV